MISSKSILNPDNIEDGGISESHSYQPSQVTYLRKDMRPGDDDATSQYTDLHSVFDQYQSKNTSFIQLH
jgi:hypothetical protein